MHLTPPDVHPASPDTPSHPRPRRLRIAGATPIRPSPVPNAGIQIAWLVAADTDERARPSASTPDAAVQALEIRGIEARSLWHVRLGSSDKPLFELDTLADGRGGWITAGEMLRDMASQFGLAGMAIDLGATKAPWQGLHVALVVLAATDPSPGIELIASV